MICFIWRVKPIHLDQFPYMNIDILYICPVYWIMGSLLFSGSDNHKRTKALWLIWMIEKTSL